MAEDFRMAFDENMIVNTKGCKKTQFYLYFLLLSTRRARKEHGNVLIYLVPDHKLKKVFVTCALCQTFKS